MAPALPQREFDPGPKIGSRAATTNTKNVQPSPRDTDAVAPVSRLEQLRALQSSHGNYFVQRAIERYNAEHPLPRGKPLAPGKSVSKPPTLGPSRSLKALPKSAKTAVPAGKANGPVRLPGVSSPAAAAARSAHATTPTGRRGAVGTDPSGLTIAQWQAQVRSAADASLVATAPKAAAEAAKQVAGVTGKYASPKRDFNAEAKKNIPAPPQADMSAAPTDTLAESIHKMIADVSGSRLTQQTLPPLEKSPGYPGIKHPEGQYPVVGATPAVKQEQPPAPDATPAAPPAAKDVADQQSREKKKQVDALGKTVPETVGGPVSATIKDEGPKPQTDIPQAFKSDIEEALAEVLSKSKEAAKEIVDIAEKVTYPHGALKEVAPEIATEALAPEQLRLETELHSIAAAAGLEAKELDTKAAKKAQEERHQASFADTELECKVSDAQEAARKQTAQERQTIAAAAARNEDEIELKAEAAGAPPDPKLVNAREQRLLDALDRQSANSRVAYRKALEMREKALADGAREQIEAYRRTAKSEAEEIKALYANKPEKATAESWTSASWADREENRVNDLVAVLRRDAKNESQQFQTAVTQKQLEAAEKIHSWAESRLSGTHSFWEKVVRLFERWAHVAKSDTEAWQKAQDQESLENMAGDLAAISRIKEAAAQGSAAELKTVAEGLDEAHQILILQFFASKGNSILTVAGATLGRIETRRVPELTQTFRSKSLQIGEWEKLNALAQALNPDFNAWHEAGEVRGAVKGWRTDRNRLFTAIKHRTPLEIKAMTLAYADRYPGRDMSEDIDLSGDEGQRAKAALEGDVAGQDVAALHAALTSFWGADKSAAMEILRGKSSVERDELLARYKDEYHIDLRDEIDDALRRDSRAQDQAKALLAGNTDQADAIGVERALHSNWNDGADVGEIDTVYAQVRKEVEADAAGKHMTTAEVEAEYKRRAAAVSAEWNRQHAGGKPGALEETFRNRLSGGGKDLAIALANNDHLAEDAARIHMEHESLYTGDKKVLSIFRKQRERAQMEVERDLAVKRNDLRAQAAREGWPPEETQQRLDEMRAQAERDIETRAQANLDNLEKRYDKVYDRGFGPGQLTSVVELEMSGNEREEARLLRKQAGKLTGAQQVYWATFDLGTDSELLRDALRGKTRGELQQMRKEYWDKYHRNMDEDIFGDVSGREEFDVGQMLKGKPETPAEEIERIHENRDYELGAGAGFGHLWASEETDSMNHAAAKTDRAYWAYQEAVARHGPESAEAKAALNRFHDWTGYTGETITELRQKVDSVSDHLAMAAAIVGAAIVAAMTAGSATPAVIAALSALGGTTASIWAKLLTKGHAYGIEDYGTDLAIGGVDMAAAALTAGVGNALLRTNLLSRLAEDQLLTKTLRHGTAHAAAGMVAGLPVGATAQLLNPATWQSQTPLRDFLRGVGESELMAAAMAFGFGAWGTLKERPGAHGGKGDGMLKLVQPGSPEYRALLHEGWTESMLRGELETFEQAVPDGPELSPGVFKKGLRAPERAYNAYNEAVARARGREVGIFRNLDNGEYVVVVGDEGFIDVPGGNHEAVLHYHPNDENVLLFRMPSDADVAVAMRSSARTGRPATQFIEHPIPGTTKRGRTAVTVDAETGAIKIEYTGPDGQRIKLEFPDKQAFSDYRQSKKIAVSGKSLEQFWAETDAWLEARRSGAADVPGEEAGLSLAMAAKKKPATAPKKPRSPGMTSLPVGPTPTWDFEGGTLPEKRTARTGGILKIGKMRIEGVVNTVIEGILMPSINPRKKLAPNYNELRQWRREQLEEALMGPLLDAGLTKPQARARAKAFSANYEAAHLWGPGFGDEAAAGMMWAPVEVNQRMQNRFAEQFARDLGEAARNAGGTVHVKAKAVPYSRQALKARGLPEDLAFLEHVEYDIRVELPQWKSPREIRVTVEAGLPGPDAGGSLKFYPEGIADRFMEWFGR